MSISHIERGQRGEDLAAHHLESLGWQIIARNWRPGNALRGEIDIIARDGKILCFVEVKTRSSNQHGAPQESVTRAKQKQISALANAYVSLQKLDDTPCRFDVIEVWLPGNGEAKLALHRNAFDFIPASRGKSGSRVF